jgi:uncharacterized membrane protein
MKTNIKLIELMVSNGLDRHYAVFLKLKHIHVNSRVYNYSPYKFSQQSGLSRNSIKKYIDFFITEGWARIEGKDLVLISTEKLKSKYSVKLKHNIKVDKGSVTEIVNNLRYQLFILKQNQFKRLKRLKEYRDNPKGKGAVKMYRNATKQLQSYKGEFSENLKISTNKLGLLINKSKSTASRLIKQSKATVIKGKRVFIKFTNKAELPEGMFKYNRYVVKIECNQYIF